MNLPINSLQLIIIIATITFLLLFFLYSNYKKIKSLEMNRLNYLFLDFKKEEKIYKNLKAIDFDVEKTQRETHLKFNKIHVVILNINFSLTEIFK